LIVKNNSNICAALIENLIYQALFIMFKINKLSIKTVYYYKKNKKNKMFIFLYLKKKLFETLAVYPIE